MQTGPAYRLLIRIAAKKGSFQSKYCLQTQNPAIKLSHAV